MADIFLSSTYTEMVSYRRAAAQAIKECDHDCIEMEEFTADRRTAEDYCRAQVRRSKVVVLVLGFLYGSSPDPNGSGVSYTELEYDAAKEDPAIPVLLFKPDDSANTNFRLAQSRLRAEGYDPDDQDLRQKRFWDKVKKGQMPATFKNEEDLKSKIISALSRHFKELPETAAEPVRSAGRILPLLCDRTQHVGDFALKFDRAPAGAPEIYILHGRDEDRLESCVERLVCLNMLRAHRTIAPAGSRAVEFPRPDPEEPEAFAITRFPFILYPLLSDKFVPTQGGSADLCQSGLTCGAKYIVFRHVMNAKRWDARIQSYFFGAYLEFWDSVAECYAKACSDPTPPRFLIFLEFKDSAGESATFRADLQKSLELRSRQVAGRVASAVHLLPRLRDVEEEHLETWMGNFRDRLVLPFRGQRLDQLFPVTPLPMSEVEDKLRTYLGLKPYGN